MINDVEFKKWLEINTSYSSNVIGDTISRAKRADKLLPLTVDSMYQYQLSQLDQYKELSVSVRSQIKKAVGLYQKFCREEMK